MKHDSVNNPSHYIDGKIEVIDFIEDKKLNFHLGNTVKYVSRAGKKDPAKTIEDLEKASWYLKREIDRLKKEAEQNYHPSDFLPKKEKLPFALQPLALTPIEESDSLKVPSALIQQLDILIKDAENCFNNTSSSDIRISSMWQGRKAAYLEIKNYLNKNNG